MLAHMHKAAVLFVCLAAAAWPCFSDAGDHIPCLSQPISTGGVAMRPATWLFDLQGELCLQLDAIEGVGLKGAQVEHSFTLAWNLWGRTPEQVQAVSDYLRAQGVDDVPKVIFHHPKLLEYDVSSDGSELQSGRRARAKVTLGRDDAGEQTLLVSYYAAQASFKTAPLSPYKP